MDEILVSNARKALSQVLDLRPGESFLVVTDEETRPVAEAFEEAARSLDASPVPYVIPGDIRPLKEIPPGLAPLIEQADIAVTCFVGRPEETPFRIELIRAMSRSVRRLGHGPGMTENMLRGPVGVDYTAMAGTANRLMERMQGAITVHITAPGGTHLTLNVANRPFMTDTVIEDGKWGNLPAGEIWCAPVEDAASGILVCDGSIGDLGQVPSPVSITLTDGRITDVDCDDDACLHRLREVLAVDDEAKIIGELGIGLNPGAGLTGNLLEDEKAGGTAHIAFGNNEDMGGGRNRSATHRDFLFQEPTFTVSYADGRVEKPIVDGEIVEARDDEASVSTSYDNVLVAVDFSDASMGAIKVADAVARRNGARLTVCHVIPGKVPVSPLFPHYVAMPEPEMAKREWSETALQLQEMVQEAIGRDESEFETRIVSGQPAPEISGLAETVGADIIILASRGLSRIARVVMGSVAESVVRRARCHVLVVR